MLKCIACIVAALAVTAPAVASDPVPMDQAPYAKRPTQLAADPAASSVQMNGEWRADVRGGGYVSMIVKVGAGGVLSGTYKAVLLSGTREMTFGKDVHGKIVGTKLTITFPNGSYEGTLQGGQFVGHFTKGPNAPANLHSGSVTYRKM